MNNPWILSGIGIIFCLWGGYKFYRQVFEENQSIAWPICIMVFGIILIAIGTASYLKWIP